MPHIDEGMLHAYLDGALDALHEAGALPDAMTAAAVITHLQQCADCRARLDSERAVREQAGMVLHDAAGPAVVLPPFEQLHGDARPRRRAGTWLPYAWAASVVMAVGAGWWGSQLARDEGMLPITDQQADARVMSDTVQPDAGVQPAADVASTGRAEPAPAPVQPDVRSESGAGASGALQQQEQVAVPERTLAAAGDSARARAADRGEQLRVEPAASVNPLAQLRGAPGEQRNIAAAPPPPAAPQSLAAGFSSVLAGQPLARFMGALQVDRSQGIAWRSATVLDSAAVAPIGADSATDTRIEVGHAPDIGNIVRVRQRLASGADIELVQWRQPGAADLAFKVQADVAERRAAAHMHYDIFDRRVLPDGIEQLVVQVPDSGTFVAIRVTGIDPRTVAERLIVLRWTVRDP